MNINAIKLKIKAKSLAEEARIIRKEEQKLHGWRKSVISEHRRFDVRNEARATHLARTFLRGKSYKSVESSSSHTSGYIWEKIQKRVLAMVQKYGDRKTTKEDISFWLEN